MLASSSVSRFLILIGVLMLMAIPGFSHNKNETISATAWGTSTQLGANVSVTLIIYQYSTPADRELLVQVSSRAPTKAWSKLCRK